MTIKQAYENCLVELNKVLAPSLLLTDFVYLFNKAVLKYINKRYNLFETSQLLTDDLRVLLRTKKITGTDLEWITSSTAGSDNVFEENSYLCKLPTDYVHMLNCICEFENTFNSKCSSCKKVIIGANKLDTSQWSHILENHYMKPSIKRPYYYISNIDDYGKLGLSTSKTSEIRYGNSIIPTMLIKCGGDITKYTLQAVYIDYLRAPEYMDLTHIDLDSNLDKTPELEFPDYVIFEIINELVTMILENGKDQRLQTYIPISQSVTLANSK